jgi:hypothetical protein
MFSDYVIVSPKLAELVRYLVTLDQRISLNITFFNARSTKRRVRNETHNSNTLKVM